MINLYESKNNRLNTEKVPFEKGTVKVFPNLLPDLNNGKMKSNFRSKLIRDVIAMPVINQTENFEIVERFKILEEQFDGRDDEPIIGKAAEEFALEAQRHPERYDFLCNWLAEELIKQPQKSRLILDIGSGPGILTQAIAKMVADSEVLGIDLSPDMLQIAKRNNTLDNVNFVFADARRAKDIPYRPVDAAISRRMIHRVDDLEKTLESIARTLNTGGVMLNFSFRKPTDASDQNLFLAAAAKRAEFKDLHAAFVRAVLNAPTIEDYETACKNIARKLDLKHYSIKTFPFDVGIVFIK